MQNLINSDLFGDPGMKLMGSKLCLEEVIDAARMRHKWLPICVVEEWIILDAVVTEAEQEKVQAAGCIPVFLYAHKVVHDEQRRFEPGHWVRSSMATSFEDGFLLVTRNTIYVLIGPGHRKSVSLKSIFSLF